MKKKAIIFGLIFVFLTAISTIIYASCVGVGCGCCLVIPIDTDGNPANDPPPDIQKYFSGWEDCSGDCSYK